MVAYNILSFVNVPCGVCGEYIRVKHSIKHLIDFFLCWANSALK